MPELDDKGNWHPWVTGAGAAGDALLQHQDAPFKGHDADDCANKTGSKTFTIRFLSTTELNNSIEDYNSSRVGVVSPNFNMGLFPNALSQRAESMYGAL